jgi:hypothetical protein
VTVICSLLPIALAHVAVQAAMGSTMTTRGGALQWQRIGHATGPGGYDRRSLHPSLFRVRAFGWVSGD